MGIRTPVFGVKGRNDWPDYTIAAGALFNRFFTVKRVVEQEEGFF